MMLSCILRWCLIYWVIELLGYWLLCYTIAINQYRFIPGMMLYGKLTR